jgi:uncharacterized delta-60 repeat protein
MPTVGPHTAGISPGWTPFPDGSGGYTLTQWGPYGSRANAIAMGTVPGSTTQRIVTAGMAYGSTSNSNSMTVARYNTDGTLDTSFGSGGVATTVLNGWSQFFGVALQPDGEVVGAGNYQGYLAARYTVNGALDTTFNGTGWATTAITRQSAGLAYAVGLQSTGKIVEGGDVGGGGGSAILRYTSTGHLDSGKGGFGQVGKNGSAPGYTTMSMGPSDYGIQALAIQPDDKIVTVGWGDDVNNNFESTLMRFTANGLPDTTFNGGSPVLHTANTPVLDKSFAVALQPDGKIVVAGRAANGGGFPRPWDFLVARFNPNGTLDTSFNNGSGWIRVAPVAGGINLAQGVAIDGSGRIVVGGILQSGDGTTNGVAVVRLNPDGTLDTSFGTNGIKSEVFPGATQTGEDGLAIGNDGNYYLAGSVQPSSGNGETLLAYFSP